MAPESVLLLVGVVVIVSWTVGFLTGRWTAPSQQQDANEPAEDGGGGDDYDGGW